MRKQFDEQLLTLNRELTKMGALCEEAIARASKALTTGNTELAREVKPLEGEIDRAERELESLCLRLLLQQQPVARDLRQISAALKMITDMERIGDQAADIADIILQIKGEHAGEFQLIEQMAEATIKMVTESVDAYVKRDIDIASAAIRHDDRVDDYFDKIKQQLIDDISKKPDIGEYALDLLMIAKYLERIGDHAVNIAEWVVFSVTGVHKGEKV